MSGRSGMDELQEILEIMRINEGIARKFFAVEQKILNIHNFKGLFEELLFHIEDAFGVPHVWVAIAEGSELSMLKARFLDSVTEKTQAGAPATLTSVRSKIVPTGQRTAGTLLPASPGSHKYLIRSRRSPP
jgi:hypothetical protein